MRWNLRGKVPGCRAACRLVVTTVIKRERQLQEAFDPRCLLSGRTTVTRVFRLCCVTASPSPHGLAQHSPARVNMHEACWSALLLRHKEDGPRREATWHHKSRGTCTCNTRTHINGYAWYGCSTETLAPNYRVVYDCAGSNVAPPVAGYMHMQHPHTYQRLMTGSTVTPTPT